MSTHRLAALLLAACASDPPDPCGSDDGIVRGTASASALPVDETPEITVHAWHPQLGAVSTSPNAAGQWELTLRGGTTWTVYAEVEVPPEVDTDDDSDAYWGPTNCYSIDHEVAVARCGTQRLNLTLDECVTADKPNLYLYPARDTPSRVRLRHDRRQTVFASDPPYEGMWTGTAHPDGTFTPTGGARAPFLFYEITVLPGQLHGLQRTSAVCIDGDGAVEAMADLLGAYGFTDRERRDFIDGWRADLPVRPSYTVYPQRAVDHVVGVDLQPPLPLHRLWLLVEDGAGCVPSNTPPVPISRVGPHAVEWGVVLRGL